ncbi:MAG: hypothetical protein JKY65_17865 [Planctomycetes bacterium]|nr:hypothetical protein [Planctomycetota bacterium]
MTPAPAEVASPTPSAGPSAAASLLARLGEGTDLDRYQAALALVRQFPEDPRAPEAKAVLKELAGAPLLVVKVSGGVGQATFVPQVPALVSWSGGGAFQAWRPGKLVRTRSPVGAIRTTRPDGTTFVHSRWTFAAAGLGSVDLEGKVTWIFSPIVHKTPVSAALPLPNGSWVLGGAQELRICDAEGKLRSRLKLPGERVRRLYPSERGFVSLTTPPPGKPTLVLRAHTLSLGPPVELMRIPGVATTLLATYDTRRVLLGNPINARASVLERETQVGVILFTPANREASVSFSAMAWRSSQTRVVIFFQAERAADARVECWDGVKPRTRHWRLGTPGGVECSFAGPGPDYAVVSFKHEVRVYPLPLEPEQ